MTNFTSAPASAFSERLGDDIWPVKAQHSRPAQFEKCCCANARWWNTIAGNAAATEI